MGEYDDPTCGTVEECSAAYVAKLMQKRREVFETAKEKLRLAGCYDKGANTTTEWSEAIRCLTLSLHNSYKGPTNHHSHVTTNI